MNEQSIHDLFTAHRSPRRSRVRHDAVQARRQRDESKFGAEVGESRRGTDVIKDQRRKLMGKAALIATGVTLAAGIAYAALHEGVDGTEHFNAANAGNVPAKVDVQHKHNEALSAASDATSANKP